VGHPEDGYKSVSSHKLWIFLSTWVTLHCEKYVTIYFEVSAILEWLSFFVNVILPKLDVVSVPYKHVHTSCT